MTKTGSVYLDTLIQAIDVYDRGKGCLGEGEDVLGIDISADKLQGPRNLKVRKISNRKWL